MQPSNTQKCKRLYKNGLTCSEYADKIRRQNANNEPIKRLKKRVRDLFKDDYDALYDFSIKNEAKQKEFYNNPKEYILWLLEHYKTQERKNMVIEELGLSKFL